MTVSRRKATSRKEAIMRERFPGSTLAAAIAAAAVVAVTRTSAQAPAPDPAATPPYASPQAGEGKERVALKTPWGAPDLQGIWTDESDTPLQRSAKYANQEFFTAAQRAELDAARAAHYGGDPRQGRGTAIDVGGAYNTTFLTIKHAGPRTSMIVDPPDGRIPPLTPEA